MQQGISPIIQGWCIREVNQLAFLTPPFLGSISAEVCEINPHNSDFLYFFGRMMVNLLCKWLFYFEKLLFTLF
jgi:hypothetical protein